MLKRPAAPAENGGRPLMQIDGNRTPKQWGRRLRFSSTPMKFARRFCPSLSAIICSRGGREHAVL